MAAAAGYLTEHKRTPAVKLPSREQAHTSNPKAARSIVSGDMSTSVELARRDKLVRRIRDLGAADVAVAGGKGANLGELACAGFPVPDGFVLTTAAYAIAAQAAGVDPRDPAGAAERLRTAPVPGVIVATARDAYAAMGGGPVAVRSSATAEDLPGASSAGQHDTILNVTGEEALLDAVRRCWASLWNERAVAYRAANGIDDTTVALAVVVQRMVEAAVAGVLFTANPITGTRRRAAIDAVRGLADALVSGAVDPDHYLVDAGSGRVMDRCGDALDDGRLRELAAMGVRVEAHYGAPQDIEWAVDHGGKLWLVQSRAITTLYPLPADAPDPDRDLRVYFSANVAQGFFDPFTPMGVETFRLISGSLAAALGRPMRDPIRANPVLKEAGCGSSPTLRRSCEARWAGTCSAGRSESWRPAVPASSRRSSTIRDCCQAIVDQCLPR